MSPPPGAGASFKGPDDIGGDPASVKVALLGLYALAVDEAGAYPAGVKGQIPGDGFKSWARRGVAPGHCRALRLGGLDIPINGLPFEFAKTALPRPDAEKICAHVFRREVINGRVAGLQDAVGAVGLSDGDAVEFNDEVLVRLFQARRAGVIPDAFLPGFGLDLFFHERETRE